MQPVTDAGDDERAWPVVPGFNQVHKIDEPLLDSGQTLCVVLLHPLVTAGAVSVRCCGFSGTLCADVPLRSQPASRLIAGKHKGQAASTSGLFFSGFASRPSFVRTHLQIFSWIIPANQCNCREATWAGLPIVMPGSVLCNGCRSAC